MIKCREFIFSRNKINLYNSTERVSHFLNFESKGAVYRASLQLIF